MRLILALLLCLTALIPSAQAQLMVRHWAAPAVAPAATLTPSAAWDGTRGCTGCTVPAVDTSVQGQQTITGAANNGSGKCRLTVGSTAAMTTGDVWTVLAIGGSVECNGQWNITVVDGTHVDLGTTASPGPAFVNAYTSGGTIGFPEQVVGVGDEYAATVISAQDSEFVTINGAVGNRGGLDHATCYYADSGPVTITVDKIALNPATKDGGFVVKLNANASSPRDGLATLTCDLYPVNGIVRRWAVNTWINIPSLTGYITRPTVYVSSATGADPANCTNAGPGAGQNGAIGTPFASIGIAVACSHSGGFATGGQNGAIIRVGTSAADAGMTITDYNAGAGYCPSSPINCLGNPDYLVEVRPFTDPVKIASISWSANVATVTTATPNNFDGTKQVLISGQMPFEYNGMRTVTVIDSTHFTFPCCTVQNQPNQNPDALHPDVAKIAGTAVVPYRIVRSVNPRGVFHSTAQNELIVGGLVDMSTIYAIMGCSSAGCSINPQSSLPLLGGFGFKNSAIIDTASPTGPTYGYYSGSGYDTDCAFYNGAALYSFALMDSYFSGGGMCMPQLARNVSGIATYDAVYAGNGINANVGYWNVNLSGAFASNGAGGTTFNYRFSRQTIEPADNVTTANLPPLASNAVFAGGNSTFTITTATSSSLSVGLYVRFLSGGCAGKGPNTFNGLDFFTGGGSYVNSTQTVTLNGVNVADGGVCGATGAHTGDLVLIGLPDHVDAMQTALQSATGGSSAPYNIYAWHYSYIGTEQPFLPQAGAAQNASGINLCSTGTTVTFSASYTFNDGDYLGFTAGPNRYESRRIVGSGSGTTATIDRPFYPDVTCPGNTFRGYHVTRDVACVGCRLGGSGNTTGTGTVDAAGAAQFGDAVRNYIIVQNTINRSVFWYRGDANPLSLDNIAVFDSVIDQNAANGSGPSLNQVPGTTWTATSGGVNIYLGYAFEGNDYFNATQNPGMNNANQVSAINGYNYRPTGGTLTKTLGGIHGNPHVPNGFPFDPWTADGAPISAGALTGAMQP